MRYERYCSIPIVLPCKEKRRATARSASTLRTSLQRVLSMPYYKLENIMFLYFLMNNTKKYNLEISLLVLPAEHIESQYHQELLGIVA